MQITYKEVPVGKNINCFEINFLFEHGDADSRTSEIVILKNITEQQLISYIKKTNEIAEMIDDNRGIDKELPKNLEDYAVSEGFRIPIKEDCYAKLVMSNYYAEMSIESIYFYNENGNKFKVIIA